MGAFPVTAAATSAPVFGLRKTWADPGPGIAMVQIQYVWTPLGGEPEWANAEEAVLAPVPDGQGLRTAILEVPRFVDGAANYALHHFFFVVGETDRTTSPTFTEEVVAREITYADTEGEFTFIGLTWGATESWPAAEATNYTSAAMDGLSFQSAGAGAAPEPSDVYEFVHARPLPHVFRGLIWGVRGTQVRYAFHRVRQGSPDPADDVEDWLDNGGPGWVVDL